MNINQITRNSENQLAAALADKLDRFRKSKKDRLAKAKQLVDAANQLGELVRKNAAEVPAWPVVETTKPLPPRTHRPMTPEEIEMINQIKLERKSL